MMIELQETPSSAGQVEEARYVSIGPTPQWRSALRGFSIPRHIEMLDHSDVLFRINEVLGDQPSGTPITARGIMVPHGSIMLCNSLVPKLFVGLEELRTMAEADRLGILIANTRAPRAFRYPRLSREAHQAIVTLTERCRTLAVMQCDWSTVSLDNSSAR
ncbi:hypothetical protein N5K21_25380 [Rhizobium pusense]|uniref:Uncharacterized protein n=1 Tax=Agrobacterium pusense TaxID=648995 RepID=A0A6H0ZRG4_9HYPH|nr:hypothetical protein [Agrobacterium pusense]MDH2092063.1 hypothetical protein [Agrobacterium pusense]QIX22604.1 hypothetical protein FOB41_16360 [Agrobacterium pusense]WCK24515.1 hypothetical protein CFBP5496_0002660 [Agrobacterium pusense]